MITGAASGIGAETARLFAAEGARVVGVDLAEGAEGELALGPTSPTRSRSATMYARVAERDRPHRRPLQQRRHQPRRRRLGARDLARGLAARPGRQRASRSSSAASTASRTCSTAGGGSVINTASFVAVMGAAVSQISYTASKGAVLSLSRELGVEFARRGVRVNALCPGPVNTPLLQELFAKDPEKAARRLVHLPMGRFAEAREIASGRALPRQRRVAPTSPPRPSWSTAASRAPTSPRSSRAPSSRSRRIRKRPRGPRRGEEAAAELAAELVPGADLARPSRRRARRGRPRSGPRPRRSGSRRSSARASASLTSAWNWIPQATSPTRKACTQTGLRARIAAPSGGSGPRSCATGRPRSAAPAAPISGSSAPSSVTSTSCQPISGSLARRAEPPAASASSWQPRQTASSGMPSSIIAARKSFSKRSQGGGPPGRRASRRRRSSPRRSRRSRAAAPSPAPRAATRAAPPRARPSRRRRRPGRRPADGRWETQRDLADPAVTRYWRVDAWRHHKSIRRVVETGDAPAPIGPYSQAVDRQRRPLLQRPGAARSCHRRADRGRHRGTGRAAAWRASRRSAVPRAPGSRTRPGSAST